MIAVIVVAVGIVYVQTLRFDFVNYDDFELVVNNGPYLSNLSNIFDTFTTHAFAGRSGGGMYYRPLLIVTFILDYHLWGVNPLAFHLENMLLHMFVSILIFVLARRIIGNDWAGLIGALLFALHPVQTESVAWVAGRNDLLLALFIVLMMISYDRYRTGGSIRHRVLAYILYALALCTKESAAFYLLLLPAYDLCAARRPFRKMLRKTYVTELAPMGILLAGYILLRISIFGSPIGSIPDEALHPLAERFLQIPVLAIEHLALLIVPVNLSIAHPAESLFWSRQPWFSVAAALLILLLGACVWAWRRDKTLCFGLLWLVVGLLPVLNVIPIAVPVLEHRLYLPLAGLSLVVARLLRRFAPAPGTQKIAFAAAALVLLFFSLLSFQRLPVWQNSVTLWSDVIQKDSTADRAYFNLAGYYYGRGDRERTISLLEQYIRLKPGDYFGYVNLRRAYVEEGRYPDAVRVSRRMIARDPDSPAWYLETGSLFEQMNMPDSAIAVYREGLQRNSLAWELQIQIGEVYDRRGDTVMAQQMYRSAIGTMESHFNEIASDKQSLGVLLSLYKRTGQSDRARRLMQQ